MAKYDAFDAALQVGTQQIETAVVVITTVTVGNSNWILTASGMTGSAITTVVALAGGETASQVAAKAAIAMNLDANITALFSVVADGPNVVITRKVAVANDATLNLAYADDTSGGLTDDASSNNTQAGVAPTEIAAVTNISGPGLSMDTEDVTTHDSTAAFEEVVGTILRSGEVSLDIVYDPAGGTHDASTGLVYRMNAKLRSYFNLVFADSGSTNWQFYGYVTGFEPDSPVDGALTASVTIKLDGQPTLE